MASVIPDQIFKVSKQEQKKKFANTTVISWLKRTLKTCNKGNLKSCKMHNSHCLSRGIHFLLLLLTCKIYKLILFAWHTIPDVHSISDNWHLGLIYTNKLVTEKPLVLKVVDSGNIISHSKPESDLKLGRFHAGSVEFSQTAGVFPTLHA